MIEIIYPKYNKHTHTYIILYENKENYNNHH